MELELYFAKPVGGIFTIDAANVDAPFVGVVGIEIWGAVVRIEGGCSAAEDWEGACKLGADGEGE